MKTLSSPSDILYCTFTIIHKSHFSQPTNVVLLNWYSIEANWSGGSLYCSRYQTDLQVLRLSMSWLLFSYYIHLRESFTRIEEVQWSIKNVPTCSFRIPIALLGPQFRLHSPSMRDRGERGWIWTLQNNSTISVAYFNNQYFMINLQNRWVLLFSWLIENLLTGTCRRIPRHRTRLCTSRTVIAQGTLRRRMSQFRVPECSV